MKKVMKKRTGFTLVELLIVIIIIGILAGAMLLVAGSGTDKAEATKIVSDMRSIKAAALMKYADTTAWDFATTAAYDPAKTQIELANYMDRDISKEKYDYGIGVASGDTVVSIIADKIPNSVGVKLADVGESSGLYQEEACTNPFTAVDGTGDQKVYMRVK